MRFKVKLPNCSKYMFVSDESIIPTLGSLKKSTHDALIQIGVDGIDFEISLNGKDAIRGNDGTTLTEAGIVTGDILRIVTSEEYKDKFIEVNNNPDLDSSSSGESVTESVSTITIVARPDEGDAVRSERDEIVSDRPPPTVEEADQTPPAVKVPAAVDPDLPVTVDGELPVDTVIVNRCLKEPILCRESTYTEIPETLKQCYTMSNVKSVNDAMVVVLHVMMLEAGYVQKSSLNSDVCLSEDVKIGHIYRIPYFHVSCPHASVILTCIPIGETLTINGTYKSTTFHLSTTMNHYVRNCVLASENGIGVYENLSKLSHVFKDTVVYPLLTALQTGEGVPSSCGITSLSTEVKMIILNFLKVEGLLNLSETCREFYELANQQSLWKRLCFTDFPQYISEKFIQDRTLTWKQKYLVLYKKQKVCNVHYGPFILGQPPFALPFPNLVPGSYNGHPSTQIIPPPGPQIIAPPGTQMIPPPGIVGGEFDRIPGFPAVVLPDIRSPFFPPPPGSRMFDHQHRFQFIPRGSIPPWPGYFPGFH